MTTELNWLEHSEGWCRGKMQEHINRGWTLCPFVESWEMALFWKVMKWVFLNYFFIGHQHMFKMIFVAMTKIRVILFWWLVLKYSSGRLTGERAVLRYGWLNSYVVPCSRQWSGCMCTRIYAVVPPLVMKCFCVNCYILYSRYLFVLDNHEMSSLRGSADITERISPHEQQAVPKKEQQLSISYILK